LAPSFPVMHRVSYAIATSALGFFEARGHRRGVRPHGRAGQDDLVDGRSDDILRERRITRARREDLLGHRAGGIPGSSAHGRCFSTANLRAAEARKRTAAHANSQGQLIASARALARPS
jgi:hypothetical protein